MTIQSNETGGVGFNDRAPKPRQRFAAGLKGHEGKSLLDGWGGDGKGPKSTEDPSVRNAPTVGQAEQRIREDRTITAQDHAHLLDLQTRKENE